MYLYLFRRYIGIKQNICLAIGKYCQSNRQKLTSNQKRPPESKWKRYWAIGQSHWATRKECQWNWKRHRAIGKRSRAIGNKKRPPEQSEKARSNRKRLPMQWWYDWLSKRRRVPNNQVCTEIHMHHNKCWAYNARRLTPRNQVKKNQQRKYYCWRFLVKRSREQVTVNRGSIKMAKTNQGK